jgi:hypothetical protein
MQDVPPVLPEAKSRRAAFGWAATALVAAGVLCLFLFNPADHGFYPRCFFKMSTGLDCPGCGGLRATHQLLHGHLAQAFALNPLFVMALPVCGVVSLLKFAEKHTGRIYLRLFSATTTVIICTTVVIAFGVLRNVPWRAWLGG